MICNDRDSYMKTETNFHYTVFWDGECELCAYFAGWINKRIVLPTEIKAYQKTSNPPMDKELALACSKALHVLHPDDYIERGGYACLTILKLIGYKRTATLLRLPPFIIVVEFIYKLISKNRRIFSRLLLYNKSKYQ